MFAQELVNGISIGTIYGLFALALVVTYRSSKVINFAQGEMAMFSVFIALALIRGGMGFWGAIGLSLVVAGLLGGLIQFFLIRRAGAGLGTVVVTIGLFFFFNSLAGWIWGYDPSPFPNPFETGRTLHLGRAVVTSYNIALLCTGAGLAALLYLFFRFTKGGLTMRAVAGNRQAAMLLGIPADTISLEAWVLSSVMGALAGLLIAPAVFVDPNAMLSVLIYGLAAAVFGGLESVVGAVVGGVTIGIVENLAGGFFSAEWKTSCTFLFMLTALVFRPRGLFGGQVTQKI